MFSSPARQRDATGIERHSRLLAACYSHDTSMSVPSRCVPVCSKVCRRSPRRACQSPSGRRQHSCFQAENSIQTRTYSDWPYASVRRPSRMLLSLSVGFFAAKERTSLTFSGGTCFRMNWPSGTKQHSIGICAPDANYKCQRTSESFRLHMQ